MKLTIGIIISTCFVISTALSQSVTDDSLKTQLAIQQQQIETLRNENLELRADLDTMNRTLQEIRTGIAERTKTVDKSLSDINSALGSKVDKKLASSNCLESGSFKLCMQTDGNLVIYRGTQSRWSSFNTVNNNPSGNVGIKAGSCSWALQADGNFVRYGCGPALDWGRR